MNEPWRAMSMCRDFCGPWNGTRRELSSPRGWDGLSGDERDVLVRFLRELGEVPDELHTHVPVGLLPEVFETEEDPAIRFCIIGRWPFRIDACLRFGDEWWLVECKQDAGHACIGQALFYWFLWCRDVIAKRATRSVVACKRCDPQVGNFARRVGLDVVVV